MVVIKNNTLAVILLALTVTFLGCKKEEENIDLWSIPIDEVFDGGPGKDGIPSLENPSFTNAGGATYLTNDDLILGYVSGNQIKAYPHNILDWHEIINDQINGKSICINYCPLTGTGMNWSSIINGSTTEFGVSGMLYNTNVIPYDRNTDSNWSQLLMACVNGELLGQRPEIFQLVETTWGTWKEMYPNTQVVSEETGFDRNYTEYPYGDYRTNHSKILFPVSNTDSRLPNKERVHSVVIDNSLKAYSINAFTADISVIVDEFKGKQLVVAGSKTKNIVVSFERTLNDSTLSFSPVQNELPTILEDNEGTKWDIFGKGVSGPREGEQLKTVTSLMGYWVAFPSFYSNLELYE